MRVFIASVLTAATVAGMAGGFAVVDKMAATSGENMSAVTVSAMTDGLGRNRGTRPHHPRASCRCN